jgi:hypothetical protein
MMRFVMTSRLPIETDAAWRETALVWAEVGVVEADRVEADRVEEDFDAGLEWCFVVLNGFAMGARLGSPGVLAAVEVVADFGAGCFFFVGEVSSAYDVRQTKTVRQRNVVARRRNNIYCTPKGLVVLAG